MLLGAGCGADSADQVLGGSAPAGTVVSAQTAHGMEQDAIRGCMREAGFEFVAPAFVDRGVSNGATGRIRLGNADSYGYGGVFFSIEFLTPGGEPSSDTPDSDLDSYFDALNGGIADGFVQHTHGEGSHSHGEDEADHAHDFASKGCYAVGEAAIEELVLEEGETDVNVVLSRIQSSDEFIAFSEDWLTCMRESGVVVRSSNPVTHSAQARDAYFDRAQQRFVEIFASDQSGYFLDQYTVRDVLTQAWFFEVLAQDDVIAEVHAEEVAEATQDRACREPVLPGIDLLLEAFE